MVWCLCSLLPACGCRGTGQCWSLPAPGPNTALEATGHSVRFVAGVSLYHVARASAWALDPAGVQTKPKTRRPTHTSEYPMPCARPAGPRLAPVITAPRPPLAPGRPRPPRRSAGRWGGRPGPPAASGSDTASGGGRGLSPRAAAPGAGVWTSALPSASGVVGVAQGGAARSQRRGLRGPRGSSGAARASPPARPSQGGRVQGVPRGPAPQRARQCRTAAGRGDGGRPKAGARAPATSEARPPLGRIPRGAGSNKGLPRTPGVGRGGYASRRWSRRR